LSQATSYAADERQRLVDALIRVREGSQPALAEVYNRTSSKLFGICLRILGDRSEAEDALQEVYVNVWRKAGSFDPSRASPISWLAAMARNRAIDHARSSGRRKQEPIELAAHIADDAASAPEVIEQGQESRRLQNCLGELEQRQSQAIRAAFFDGYTYSELAERTDVPLGTMKSWVRRGLLRLKECLGNG
jgi:RNA polymerase sigma-70 factor (ECF subfamily)